MTDDPRSPLELLEALDRAKRSRSRPASATSRSTRCAGCSRCSGTARSTPTTVLVTCGGGMGSLLGPADGLYHDLGVRLRRARHRHDPRRLPQAQRPRRAACTTWPPPPTSPGGAARARFVVMGHSFGGAVAIQTGAVLGTHCRGVVTLSTQSAGCEVAAELGDTPLLLLHGTDDEILPAGDERGRADARRSRRGRAAPRRRPPAHAKPRTRSASASTSGSPRGSPPT